jgi:hypothetical protein
MLIKRTRCLTPGFVTFIMAAPLVDIECLMLPSPREVRGRRAGDEGCPVEDQ